MVKTKNKRIKWSDIKTIIVVSLVILLFTKFAFDIYDGNKMRRSLRTFPKKTITATVIDEKYYWGNNRVTQLNTYKYTFIVDNFEYEGICDNKNYNPGDKIIIDYVIDNPKYNCPSGLYKDE